MPPTRYPKKARPKTFIANIQYEIKFIKCGSTDFAPISKSFFCIFSLFIKKTLNIRSGPKINKNSR